MIRNSLLKDSLSKLNYLNLEVIFHLTILLFKVELCYLGLYISLH